MSDEQIRQILIARKREERYHKMQRREEIKETIEDILGWVCWGVLAYMAFLGAYIIGG